MAWLEARGNRARRTSSEKAGERQQGQGEATQLRARKRRNESSKVRKCFKRSRTDSGRRVEQQREDEMKMREEREGGRGATTDQNAGGARGL
eukprot:6014255-Pleurochrysis_carterae.AAC.1